MYQIKLVYNSRETTQRETKKNYKIFKNGMELLFLSCECPAQWVQWLMCDHYLSYVNYLSALKLCINYFSPLILWWYYATVIFTQHQFSWIWTMGQWSKSFWSVWCLSLELSFWVTLFFVSLVHLEYIVQKTSQVWNCH